MLHELAVVHFGARRGGQPEDALAAASGVWAFDMSSNQGLDDAGPCDR